MYSGIYTDNHYIFLPKANGGQVDINSVEALCIMPPRYAMLLNQFCMKQDLFHFQLYFFSFETGCLGIIGIG